jgi:hypothetical protein
VFMNNLRPIHFHSSPAAPPLAVTLLSEKAPMCDTQATLEIKDFA